MAHTSLISPPRRNQTPFGTPSTQRKKETRVRTSRYQNCVEETKYKFPMKKTEEMASDPKAPELMEWQQGDQGVGAEGGDQLSRTSAPSVETRVTHLARTHSADRTPPSPFCPGFLAKYGGKSPWGDCGRTPEPTSESIMAIRMGRLDQILSRFEPKLTVSQDRQHLSFSSLPTDILLMAQQLLNVQ